MFFAGNSGKQQACGTRTLLKEKKDQWKCRYSLGIVTWWSRDQGEKGKNKGSTISVGRRRNRREGGFVYRLRTLNSNSRSVSCPWQTTGHMSRKVRLAGVFPVSVSGSSGSSCSISCRSPGSLQYSQRQVCCLIQTW